MTNVLSSLICLKWFYVFISAFGSFQNFLLVHILACPYCLPELTKVTQTVWLKIQKSISTQFWNLDVQDKGVNRVDFFWGLSLACTKLSSSSIFMWSSFCVLSSSACKDNSHCIRSATYMISSTLNTTLNVLSSNAVTFQRLTLYHINLRETLLSICKSKEVYPWKTPRWKKCYEYTQWMKSKDMYFEIEFKHANKTLRQVLEGD